MISNGFVSYQHIFDSLYPSKGHLAEPFYDSLSQYKPRATLVFWFCFDVD